MMCRRDTCRRLLPTRAMAGRIEQKLVRRCVAVARTGMGWKRMKLGTLKDDTRDGKLVVVARDLSQCVAVPEIARTLQAVLDDWKAIAPRLDEVYRALNAGSRKDAKPFDAKRAAAP